jgi:HK97 gp10 family phage protein
MADDVSVRVVGLDEVQAKMRQVESDLGGGPMVGGMRDATLIVMRAARVNAPVDTGRLRASIMPEVKVGGVFGGKRVQGIVGSNVRYAPFQELGTRPFWPPLSALERWAQRHGTTAYVVARAIARRGIVAKRYLGRALEDNRDRIERLIGSVVSRIVSR